MIVSSKAVLELDCMCQCDYACVREWETHGPSLPLVILVAHCYNHLRELRSIARFLVLLELRMEGRKGVVP